MVSRSFLWMLNCVVLVGYVGYVGLNRWMDGLMDGYDIFTFEGEEVDSSLAVPTH